MFYVKIIIHNWKCVKIRLILKFDNKRVVYEATSYSSYKFYNILRPAI